MNRKSNFANIVLSALIGLTLVLSAAQPVSVNAAPVVQASVKLEVDPVSESVMTLGSSIIPAEYAPEKDAGEVVMPDYEADPQATGTWPLYIDVVIDEPRHRLYASDWAGNKVDVISTDTLTLVKSFTGLANPRGLALSPDGNELAIANYGVGEIPPVTGSIVFVNLLTDTISATVIPNVPNPQYNRPWDVIYGRTGRLYSTGNPYSQGLDYIHVIDTSTHTEVGRSYVNETPIRMYPTMQLSPDENTLYVLETNQSPTRIYKYDVTSDTPIRGDFTSDISAGIFLLSDDGSKIITDSGDVWGSDLKGKIGSTGQGGKMALLPTRNVIAVTKGFGA